MKSMFDNTGSEYLWSYMVLGVMLFVGFRVVIKFVLPLLKNKQVFIKKYWVKIQIFAWLVFSTLFYIALLKANFYITLIFSAIIIGLGWNFWRNVFSGIIIKLNDEFKKGETISSEDTTGVLDEIGYSHTRLVNAEGETVWIPNIKLRSSILKKHRVKSNIQSHSFTIEPSVSTSVEDIYQLALDCPYISGNQNIIVKKTESQKYVIKATVIDDSFIDDVQRYFTGQ